MSDMHERFERDLNAFAGSIQGAHVTSVRTKSGTFTHVQMPDEQERALQSLKKSISEAESNLLDSFCEEGWDELW